jgi:hypothetical protein
MCETRLVGEEFPAHQQNRLSGVIYIQNEHPTQQMQVAAKRGPWDPFKHSLVTRGPARAVW